jgi:hypothetical protein
MSNFPFLLIMHVFKGYFYIKTIEYVVRIFQILTYRIKADRRTKALILISLKVEY